MSQTVDIIVNPNIIEVEVTTLGEQGIQGIQGIQGFNGWQQETEIEIVQVSGVDKAVKKLVGYFGGTGTEPTDNVGKYEGVGGWVDTPAEAFDYINEVSEQALSLKADKADIQSNIDIVFADLTANTYVNILLANKINVPIAYKNPTSPTTGFLNFNGSGIANLPVTAVAGFTATIFGTTGVLNNFASKTQFETRNNFILDVAGDTSNVYNILRSIRQWDITAKQINGSRFYIVRVGLEGGVPSIIINNGSSLGMIKFVKTLDFAGFSNYVGTEIDASNGWNGNLIMPTAMSNMIAATDYTNPSTSSGPYFIAPANVTKVPYDFYAKSEVNALIAAAPSSTSILSKLAFPSYTGLDKKLPNWFNNWKNRTRDLTVVVYGDSLSVRSTNNTQFPNPEYRPPLCNGMNWASAVWDKLKWGREMFWRYDGLYSGLARFTEAVGSFVTVITNQGDTPNNGINSTQWDDFVRREGYTRMYSGTANATLTFKMIDTSSDKEACLDFIYRTDLNGSDVNTVTIAEGNGKLKVWDKTTEAYVEANGYVFSMKHGAVSTYRGNTKFNEVLKFRAVIGTSFDTRNSAKTITITKTDSSNSRFMYWGIQTSIEPYMVRIVSAGRGGLDLETLLPFIDDDVYDHNPDLIIHEIPVNGGINTPGGADPAPFYASEFYTWFFDLANAKSIKSNSGATAWSDYETIVWSPQCSESGFFDANSFKTQRYADGNWYGVADNRRHVAKMMKDNDQVGVVFIDMFEKYLLESKAIYGDYRTGFTDTTITSEGSFLGDDIHQNDLGVKLMDKHILSVFDFN